MPIGRIPMRIAANASRTLLQTLTDLEPNATILSVDGVGAFDLTSSPCFSVLVGGEHKGDLSWNVFAFLDDLYVVSSFDVPWSARRVAGGIVSPL